MKFNDIGDGYHKYVYTTINSITSGLTDSFDFALTDIMEYVLMAGTGILGISLCRQSIIDQPSQFNIESILLSLGAFTTGSASIIGLVLITYGMNYFRTPIYEKLQLLPEDLNYNDEIQYTIDRLNYFADSDELDLDELNIRVNIALDDFVLKYEAYPVPHPDKIKTPFFLGNYLRMNIMGLINPFIPELLVASELHADAIAHEKAHLVGYAKETEAELVGYLCLHESGDPSLLYLTYLHRIGLLINASPDLRTDNKEIDFDKLRDLGLNERSINEIENKGKHVKEQLASSSKIYLIFSPLVIALKTLELNIMGEGSAKEAYVLAPLKYISAFDPPALE